MYRFYIDVGQSGGRYNIYTEFEKIASNITMPYTLEVPFWVPSLRIYVEKLNVRCINPQSVTLVFPQTTTTTFKAPTVELTPSTLPPTTSTTSTTSSPSSTTTTRRPSTTTQRIVINSTTTTTTTTKAPDEIVLVNSTAAALQFSSDLNSYFSTFYVKLLKNGTSYKTPVQLTIKGTIYYYDANDALMITEYVELIVPSGNDAAFVETPSSEPIFSNDIAKVLTCIRSIQPSSPVPIQFIPINAC